MARPESSRPTSMNTKRPRVLLVPDSLYWAAMVIAKEIAANNPGFRFETQSEPVLTTLLERFADYPRYFDVVHFLLPHAASRLAHYFEKTTAVVTTLHHIETEYCTDSLGGADAVMVGTTQWRDKLVEYGLPTEKLFHLPYGVDTTLFRPACGQERRRLRRELGLPTDAFVVGYCGKNSKRKGVDVLLDGLRRLTAELPRAVCILLGPGWSGLVAEGLPLVRLPFTIDRRRLAEFYRAMDVLWVTSRIEGGPIPVLEAMASGVPCISTRVGIPLDVVVDDENGFLVPFDDPEAFCETSIRLAVDDELREGVAGRARATVVRDCQWSQVMPMASDLYERSRSRFQQRARQGGYPVVESLSDRDLPGAWRQWSEGREHHSYSTFLLNRREYASAAQLAWLAWRSNPRDLKLWLHAVRASAELTLRALRLNPRELKFWLHLKRQKIRSGAGS